MAAQHDRGTRSCGAVSRPRCFTQVENCCSSRRPSQRPGNQGGEILREGQRPAGYPPINVSTYVKQLGFPGHRKPSLAPTNVFRAPVTGYGLRVTGYGLRVTGYGLRVTGYGLRVTGFRQCRRGQNPVSARGSIWKRSEIRFCTNRTMVSWTQSGSFDSMKQKSPSATGLRQVRDLAPNS